MKFKFVSFIFAICLCFFSCSSALNNSEQKAQAETIRNLGEAYLAAGNPTLAIRELLKADSMLPNDPYTQNGLGLAYLSRGIIDKSIFHFKKAIELKPEYAPAINNLGTAYLAEGNWDMAIETLTPLTKNILYATPHFAESNIAYAFLNKRDFLRAEKHYKNSLELYPNYITALRGLCVVYRQTGDYRSSLSSINRAIKYYPKNGELYLQKANTLILMGEKEKAKKEFLNAVSFGNDDVVDEARAGLEKL